MSFVTAKIGKGKVVHAYYMAASRTDCAAAGMSDAEAVLVEGPVTCKRCLKGIAKMVESAHAEALRVEADRVHLDAIVEDAKRTTARMQSAEAERVEQAHAEALAMDQAEPSCWPHWIADASGVWTQDGEEYVCDVPVRRGTFGHPGPCVDRVAGVQRHALTLTARQRREARRADRAKLRARAPRARAVARARRARQGNGRATAKTLLVASGVHPEVAGRYAPAFSRRSEAQTVPTRIQLGPHKSKRVHVKRYTWAEFQARADGYSPATTLGQYVARQVRTLAHI